MYALRCKVVHRADDVLINCFRHERSERCGEAGKRFKHCEQRHIRRFFIHSHFLAPITFSAAANVPIGKVINKAVQFAPRFGNAEVFKIVIHCSNERVKARKQPFVHYGKVFANELMLRGVKFINICVQNVERICVPQRTHIFALHFAYGVAAETAGQPRTGGGVEIPTHRIRTLFC